MDARADEFFAVFKHAPAAVEAAVAIQRAVRDHDWPADGAVMLRAGVHSGRPTLTEGGYVGLAVHTTARVSAAAHGGQILLTGAATRAIGEALVEALSFVELGTFRLRGLPEHETLYQVTVSDLPGAVPAARHRRLTWPAFGTRLGANRRIGPRRSQHRPAKTRSSGGTSCSTAIRANGGTGAIFRRLPSNPRCRLCAAPFGGIGGPIVRTLWGKRPADQNPNLCGVCFSFVTSNHGGAEIDMSMLFADIRGSTSLAETMPPGEYRALLDRFYNVAADAVFANDGFLDKFVGDEVVATFVPLLDRRAARQPRGGRGPRADDEHRLWQRNRTVAATRRRCPHRAGRGWARWAMAPQRT